MQLLQQRHSKHIINAVLSLREKIYAFGEATDKACVWKIKCTIRTEEVLLENRRKPKTLLLNQDFG
jgi:hypothetical protein